MESQFCLTEGVEVFAAEIIAIKEAITHSHPRDFGELEIYSEKRSTLQEIRVLVHQHETIAQIKYLA